jgi:hypothetical protein
MTAFFFIFHKQFYVVLSGLKFTGHGNPDNNLESPSVKINGRRIGKFGCTHLTHLYIKGIALVSCR